jgi:hypothetical protein
MELSEGLVLEVLAGRTLLHPFKCHGYHNDLPRSRRFNWSRFDRQLCPIDLEVANLIAANPFWPPSSEYMGEWSRFAHTTFTETPNYGLCTEPASKRLHW